MSEPAHAAPPITVLLADDEPLMRQSLRIVIDSQPDFYVVAEATNGAETVATARTLVPDVILMDIRMPGSDGIHATQAITADPMLRTVRVLVLSMYELDEYVYGALKAGASGFLLKDVHPTVLLAAIRRIHEGEALYAPSILTRLVEHYVSRPVSSVSAASATAIADAQNLLYESTVQLTPRENEVLTLIGRGLSNDEITAELFVSGNTVKTHIGNVMSKLHARDRAQLVIAAYQRGLVSAAVRRR